MQKKNIYALTAFLLLGSAPLASSFAADAAAPKVHPHEKTQEDLKKKKDDKDDASKKDEQSSDGDAKESEKAPEADAPKAEKPTTETTTTGFSVSESGAIPPSLKINGFTLFNSYIVKQSNRTNGKGGAPLHFATDVSDLYFTIAGKSNTNIDYMYRVNFAAYSGSSPTIDQNYIQIKTPFYAFRLGSTVGPEDFMIKDAGAVIGGAGAFESAAYTNVYNLSAGVIKGNDIIGDTNKAAKIVFIGPEYKGFQFSVAYTPNVAKGGDADKNNMFPDNSSIPGNSKGIYPEKATYPFGTNNWAFGLSYKASAGLWSLTLTGATVHEKSYYTVTSSALPYRKFSLKNSWAYQLGMVVEHDKWSFGAGYLNNGKSRLPRIANMPLNATGTVTTGNMHQGNSGQAWNAGLGYTLGAYEFAAAYHQFWRKTDATNKARNNMISATMDVNIFKGWKWYLEIDHIRTRTSQPAVDFATAVNGAFSSKRTEGIGNNSGTVAIVGTKVSF